MGDSSSRCHGFSEFVVVIVPDHAHFFCYERNFNILAYLCGGPLHIAEEAGLTGFLVSWPIL